MHHITDGEFRTLLNRFQQLLLDIQPDMPSVPLHGILHLLQRAISSTFSSIDNLVYPAFSLFTSLRNWTQLPQEPLTGYEQDIATDTDLGDTDQFNDTSLNFWHHARAKDFIEHPKIQLYDRTANNLDHILKTTYADQIARDSSLHKNLADSHDTRYDYNTGPYWPSSITPSNQPTSYHSDYLRHGVPTLEDPLNAALHQIFSDLRFETHYPWLCAACRQGSFLKGPTCFNCSHPYRPNRLSHISTMLWCVPCMDYTSINRVALVNNAHAPTGRAQAYFSYDHLPQQLMFLLPKRLLQWTLHEHDFSNNWTLFLMLLTKHGIAFPLGLHGAVKHLRRSINPEYLSTDYRDAFTKPSYPCDSSITTGSADKPIPTTTHYASPRNFLVKDSPYYDRHINPHNHYIYLDHTVIFECIMQNSQDFIPQWYLPEAPFYIMPTYPLMSLIQKRLAD